MSKDDLQVGSVDIALTTGIKIDGTITKTLRMREPTVADQIAISEKGGSDALQEINLMANLCMVTPDQIRTLTLRDYRVVQKAFLGFTG